MIRLAGLLLVAVVAVITWQAVTATSAFALSGAPVDIEQALTDVQAGNASPMEWEEFQSTIDWLASESGVPDSAIPYPEIPRFGGYTGEASNWGLDPDVKALMEADQNAVADGAVSTEVGGDIVGASVFEGFMPAMSAILPVIGTAGAVGGTFAAGWEIGTVVRSVLFPSPSDNISGNAQLQPWAPAGERLKWYSFPGCGVTPDGQLPAGDNNPNDRCHAPPQLVPGRCTNGALVADGGNAGAEVDNMPCDLPHGPREFSGAYVLEYMPPAGAPGAGSWVDLPNSLSYDTQSFGPCGYGISNAYAGQPPGGLSGSPRNGYTTLWGNGADLTGQDPQENFHITGFCPDPGGTWARVGRSLTFKSARSLHNSMPKRGVACPSPCTQVAPQDPSLFQTTDANGGAANAAGVLKSYLDAGNGAIHEPVRQYINSHLTGTGLSGEKTTVIDPTTGKTTVEPGTVAMPDCGGLQPAACKQLLTQAGFTAAPTETTLTPAQVDLTKPAGAVVTTTPAPNTNVDPATVVQLTENPSTLPIVIPAPNPGETYQAYIARLQSLGFVGTITETDLTDATLDPTQGPGVAIRTNPAVGTQVAPDTSIVVYANPANAPNPITGNNGDPGGGTGTGGAGPLAPDLPGFRVPGAPTPCTVFPFGLPCWLGGALGSLASVPAQAPSFSISTPAILGGTPIRVDLGNIFGFDFSSVMGIIRPVLLLLSLIGLVVWLVGMAMGGGTGGGGGAESED